jgi:outer membrane protein TolC
MVRSIRALLAVTLSAAMVAGAPVYGQTQGQAPGQAPAAGQPSQPLPGQVPQPGNQAPQPGQQAPGQTAGQPQPPNQNPAPAPPSQQGQPAPSQGLPSQTMQNPDQSQQQASPQGQPQDQTAGQGENPTGSQTSEQTSGNTSGQTAAQTQQTPSQASGIQQPSFNLSYGRDYSKGTRWFPQVFAPYKPIKVDKPQFVNNSPRINDLIKDGKLYLSLQDAIGLALADNVDITVERYVPWIAETDILRTLSGGTARGLNGTGTASTLGTIPVVGFDPVFTSNLLWERSSFPVSNPFLSGLGTTTALLSITNNIAQVNFGYSQAFHTGTSVSITWDTTRESTTSPGTIFNPFVQSTVTYTVQQPLLNGFGKLPNTRFIVEAKNTKLVADSQLQQQVMTTVAQVETDYWELVYARENVNVQDSAVGTAQKLYGDNQKQVQIGTLAPLEVTRAESQLATNQQNLIVAQTTAQQQQSVLLNVITKNPMAPNLQGIEVIPTDEIPAPRGADNLSLQEAVNEALTKRPEILQTQLNLKNDKIEIKATRNSLLPIANLFGQYQQTGLGGNLLTSSATSFGADTEAPVVNAGGTPVLVGGQPVYVSEPLTFNSSTLPGGLNQALTQVYQNDYPTYLVGLNVTVPFRNRSAQADAARALLNERQLETQYQQTQNTIFLNVRNAMIALQQDRARVDAASKARILAQETLDADGKKYQLGATTTFQVIQDQRDVTSAQGTEIRAKADLIEAQINYDQAMGRTLEINNISVGDAKAGSISASPNIPGTPSSQLPAGR